MISFLTPIAVLYDESRFRVIPSNSFNSLSVRTFATAGENSRETLHWRRFGIEETSWRCPTQIMKIQREIGIVNSRDV